MKFSNYRSYFSNASAFRQEKKMLKFCDMSKIKSLVCSKRKKIKETKDYQKCPLKDLLRYFKRGTKIQYK